jgi:hypothetical protein
MDPWPIRERMAKAGIPLEPNAVRTPEQEAILGKEYLQALAKLPKGSVVFDGPLGRARHAQFSGARRPASPAVSSPDQE